MHRVLILGGDQDLRRRVQALLSEVGHISAVSELDHLPSGDVEAARAFQLHQPQVVLTAFTSMFALQEFMQRIEANVPEAAVVALTQFTDHRTVRELMQCGVKGIVPIPLVKGVFVDAMTRVFDQLRATSVTETTRNLFAFLPGKGGSGTSQLACNFANELANSSRLPAGQRVLLLDLDLSSGISRYVFERRNTYTLTEMVESGVPLNDVYWSHLAAAHGNLDVVAGGRYNPRHPLTPLHIKQVLDASVPRYAAVCVDLTPNTEAFALEVLRRASRTFLVTSTDPGSIALTQNRFRFLDSIGLGRHTGLFVSRFWDQPTVTLSRMASDIGAPVLAEFDFDDRSARDAIMAGSLLDSGTSLTKTIRRAAQRLILEPISVPA